MVTKILKVGYSAKRNNNTRQIERVPFIKLSGKYLANAGFVVGEFTKVIVADTFITLVLRPNRKGGSNV